MLLSGLTSPGLAVKRYLGLMDQIVSVVRDVNDANSVESIDKRYHFRVVIESDDTSACTRIPTCLATDAKSVERRVDPNFGERKRNRIFYRTRRTNDQWGRQFCSLNGPSRDRKMKRSHRSTIFTCNTSYW